MIAFLDQLATVVGYFSLAASVGLGLFLAVAVLSGEARRCRRARTLVDEQDIVLRPLRIVEPEPEPVVTGGQLIDILDRHRNWPADGGAA